MNISINITDRDLVNMDSTAINDLIQALKAISAHATQESEETSQSGTAKETTPKEKPKTKATPKKMVEPIETDKPASETAEPIAEDKAANYTALRDELRKELAAIARAGKSAGLKKLLEEYGVEKFSELPDEKLEDFRAAAKAL